MKKSEKKPLPTCRGSAGEIIVKCCASCAFHRQMTLETRLCMEGNGIVKPDRQPCNKYSPETIFTNKEGIGQAKVKRKAYLDYYMDNYNYFYNQVLSECHAPDSQEAVRRTREAFERKTGLSIYLDI